MHHAHADNRPLRTRTRRGLFAGLGKRLSLIAVATVIALVGSVSVAAPAFAANARLTITKLVNGQPNGTFAPGQEFTYTIEVGCDDVGFLNAVMTDPLPAQFARVFHRHHERHAIGAAEYVLVLRMHDSRHGELSADHHFP